jgi:hypothetical protein
MAQSVESHPERRFKAALEAYIDAELPQYKKDVSLPGFSISAVHTPSRSADCCSHSVRSFQYPGLRLVQYKERLFKQFQKHPDNPYNQLTAAYNTTREEKIEIYKTEQAEKEAALRGD